MTLGHIEKIHRNMRALFRKENKWYFLKPSETLDIMIDNAGLREEYNLRILDEYRKFEEEQ